MKVLSLSANRADITGHWYKIPNCRGLRRLHRRFLRWLAFRIVGYLATDSYDARTDSS